MSVDGGLVGSFRTRPDRNLEFKPCSARRKGRPLAERRKAIERFLDISGRKIWTRVIGRGPTVVLCHGGGAASVNNWPVVEDATATFATVVTYDRSGTGRSDRPPAAPTAADMADDLVAVLDVLAVERPIVLVGTSLSAFLVQLFACRRPADVAGLILLDPTPDNFLSNLVNQPPAVMESARTSLAATDSVAPSLALELERSIESAVQVRDALDAVGLPDVPFVVAVVERPESSPLTQSHAAMATRAPQGRLVSVCSTAHQTFTRDNAELIVELIHEICVGN